MLDADILRYQIGSIEQKHPFIDSERIPASRDFVEDNVYGLFERVKDVCNFSDYRAFFTGKGNFRFDIAKQQPYKGNREDFEKPANFSVVEEIVRKNNPGRVVDCTGYEADDAMSFHRFYEDSFDYLIASRDKDLGTVPGWHYRWACGEDQPEVLPYFISVFEANRFFYYQMLIGDSTDNIAGCGAKEQTYWGSKKVLVDSGDFVVDKYLFAEDGVKKRHRFASKAALGRHVDKLLNFALRSEKAAQGLFERYGVEQVPRRQGIGKVEAEEILNNCETLGEMQQSIFSHYEKRFGSGWEDICLENARLLYMGQKPDSLFEWSWQDALLEVDSTEKYYGKTEYELRKRHSG
ncbi:exonuclease [Vibrio phage Vp_R1]|uniref:Exonuclease n=1 Tax=Vibrio phage Vp_R1 TaxID=2059867 RepID=A0A2H5BQD3_9CAUD|nr:exonuclease [Vibrio phage Vp_R1]AUG88502.1 exonuclease [Vibrio phage Vp_R1]